MINRTALNYLDTSLGELTTIDQLDKAMVQAKEGIEKGNEAQFLAQKVIPWDVQLFKPKKFVSELRNVLILYHDHLNQGKISPERFYQKEASCRELTNRVFEIKVKMDNHLRQKIGLIKWIFDKAKKSFSKVSKIVKKMIFLLLLLV